VLIDITHSDFICFMRSIVDDFLTLPRSSLSVMSEKYFVYHFLLNFRIFKQSSYCILANNLTSSSTELVCNMGLNQGAGTPLFLHILLTYTIHILLLYDRLIY